MKIVISFFRQLFILICASAAACLLLGLSDFVAPLFETKLSLTQYWRATGGLSFLFLQTSLWVDYEIGAPVLFLIYFPVSIILRWKNCKAWTYILAATVIASLYALFLCYLIASLQDDPTTAIMVAGLLQRAVLKTCPMTGLLIGVFHSLILTRWQNQLQKIAIVLAVLIGIIVSAGAIIKNTGRMAYLSKSTAELQVEAGHGNIVAQRTLGRRYLDGRPKDYNIIEAIKWLRKASEQGDAQAQKYLGELYRYDHQAIKHSDMYPYDQPFVGHDYKESTKWYLNAADQGNEQAQIAIRQMYEKGQGVKQDWVEAYFWYLVAADNHAGKPFPDEAEKHLATQQISDVKNRVEAWKAMHHTKAWCDEASESNVHLDCSDPTLK